MKLHFTSLLFVVMTNTLCAQGTNDFFVERVKNEGKSFTNSVYDIEQDQLGFLWLATSNGLMQYDGRNVIRVETVKSKPGSIEIDSKGQIWLGTFFEGAIIYDPKLNVTQNLKNIIPGLSIDDPISSLTIDSDSTWIAFGRNILCVDLNKKDFYSLTIPQNMQADFYSIKLIDNSKNLWISKGPQGLLVVNPYSKVVKDISNLIDNQAVNAVAIKNDSLVLVGTSDGLYYIDIQATKKFGKNTYHDVGFSPSVSNQINTVFFDPESQALWEGRLGGGVLYRGHDKNTLLVMTESDHSLSSNHIHKIYKTRDGIIFIATESGLNKIVPSAQFFKSKYIRDYQLELSLNRSNQSTTISSIFQDSYFNYWVGTSGDGLYKLDSSFNLKEHYTTEGYSKPKNLTNGRIKSNSELNRLLGDFIYSISEDKNKNIWVGTNEGISLINTKNNKVKYFFKSKTGTGYNVKCFGEYLLVFAFTNSIVFAEKKLTLSHINDPQTILKQYNDGWTHTDQFGNFFLQDQNLNIFNHDELEFEILIPKEKNPIFSSRYLFNKRKQEVWIISSRTLHRYDLKTKTVEGHPLPEDIAIQSMFVVDDNIWFATSDGILKFDTKFKQFRLYSQRSGLGITSFAENSATINHKKEFLFGGVKGFVNFNPQRNFDQNYNQDIHVTKINLANNEPDTVFSPLINKMDHDLFSISYKQNSLQFEFTDLNLGNSSNYIYAYRLESIDKNWQFTNEPITAFYTNLPKGTYQLSLKSVDPIHKVTIGHKKNILIKVLPPPWQTWWAYTLYGFILLLAFFVARDQVVRRERLKTKAKLKEIEASKFKELDQLKSRFFANISHEFRTPLTLILAPLEKKLKEAESNEEKAELSLMHRSASRLLALVNQLLDLSRLETGTLKLNLKHANLGKFIPTITSQFASMADSKKIDFRVTIPETVELFIDHDKLEKIITNLLSNAFKFAPANGTITLSVSTGKANDMFKEGYAEIQVADTGPGIATEHVNRIFDRFYQVDSSTTRESEGTGIGLALTKELVELHRGTIAVKSEPGKGSTFIVRLPLGIGHLKAHELTLEEYPVNEPLAYAESEPAENHILNAEASVEKILVIEDNADLRQFIRNELGKTYSVLEAADGEEGLQTAFEKIPTLIITDLMMPKRDGLQLCEILKNDQRTSHVPVILLTAKADIETKLQGLNTGADDYIPKPFVMEELQVRIQNLIANRNRLREKFALQLAMKPNEVRVESVDERFLKNIMEVVEAHIPDSAFGVEQFAKETGMSQAQLYRKLHALTEFTPNEFIRHIRLQRAADLLQQNAGNIAEVAYSVGFNNLSYFAKCFKEKFGVTPSQFQ